MDDIYNVNFGLVWVVIVWLVGWLLLCILVLGVLGEFGFSVEMLVIELGVDVLVVGIDRLIILFGVEVVVRGFGDGVELVEYFD